METNDLAAAGYATATIAFGLLLALLLSRWKNSTTSRDFAGATGASALWGAILALQNVDYLASVAIIVSVESLRYVVWLIALIRLFRIIDRSLLLNRLASVYGLALLLVMGLPIAYYFFRSTDPLMSTMQVGIGFSMSVLLLGLTEQIYRNATVDLRAELSYLCVAIGGMFLYDLLLFVAVIAGFTVDAEYWSARGFINAILAVILGIGIGRTLRLSFDVQVPRQIIIYAFGLAAIGVMVILAVAAQHYIRIVGGSWGDVAGVIFLVAVILLVAILLGSISARRRLRVLLTKAFFQYKYDYRKEWLRFISTLSESGLENVPATAVRAAGQIVNSPGGIVWVKEQEGNAYVPIGSWRCEIPTMRPINDDSELVRFLNDRQWVIDLEEKQQYPARYDGLNLDSCLQESDDWWLIVPLYLGKELFGLVWLKKPRVVHKLNFEDHDLLRTVGRHVAMHINQAESDKRLAESKQFGAYNRLAAFLMHDLNNLIAQLSLVVKNAERFRQNPKFVDDAMDTIAHSVTRMKRLMAQLSSSSKPPATRQTDIREALVNAIDRCQTLKPAPQLEIGDTPMSIRADPERLTTLFEHLIRNAQDATPADGRIVVEAGASKGMVNVSIKDTGEGMSSEFVREHLFRPFDSTKGSESMGIGAYQARDYVRTLGGQITVSSEVGFGTEFSVTLPPSE
jgi:putative PEP-CTERM system histidine kinase